MRTQAGGKRPGHRRVRPELVLVAHADEVWGRLNVKAREQIEQTGSSLVAAMNEAVRHDRNNFEQIGRLQQATMIPLIGRRSGAYRMKLDEKIAIVLHGPPCSGKTTVKDAISVALGDTTVGFVSLDRYWVPTDSKYRGGPYNYRDLRSADEQVLVIELAEGEPLGYQSPGATRAARAWVDILKATNRQISAYRLWVRERDFEVRLRNRPGENSISMELKRRLYKDYLDGALTTRFDPDIVELEEKNIDTSTSPFDSPEKVAKWILGDCGTLDAGPGIPPR